MALYKQTLQGYKDIKCSEEEILAGEQAQAVDQNNR